eukprot:4291270-Alexandrium_andersonii.AAC.1
MSASLVGSEMCIRDRHTGGAALRAAPLARGAATKGVADFHRFRSRDTDCLLYTSDAADDM